MVSSNNRAIIGNTPDYGCQVCHVSFDLAHHTKTEKTHSFKVRIPILCSLSARLRPIDIEFMKRLGKIVSIVPVIAKADTLTMEERLEFKQRVSPAQQHSPALVSRGRKNSITA